MAVWNEKKFLKELTGKGNPEGKFTLLILKDWMEAKDSFWKKMGLEKQDNTVQLIAKHLTVLLETVHSSQLPQFIMYLLGELNLDDILRKHFFEILNRYRKDSYYTSADGRFIVDFIQRSEENKQFCFEHLDRILEGISASSYFNYMQKNLVGISPIVDEKINQYYETHKMVVAEEMLKDSLNFDVRVKENPTYILLVSQLLEELLATENVTFTDVHYVGSGGYSRVYGIGNKILKIGSVRGVYQIPNHDRILQPLIRTNLLDEKTDELFACIEVTQRVNTDLKGITNEELYQIFKELREQGIVWTDAKKDNLGRLEEDNHVYLYQEKIVPDAKSRGFAQNVEKILPKGELVIIDSDYLYVEGDPNIIWPSKATSRDLEERYRREKLLLRKEAEHMSNASLEKTNEEEVLETEGKIRL